MGIVGFPSAAGVSGLPEVVGGNEVPEELGLGGGDDIRGRADERDDEVLMGDGNLTGGGEAEETDGELDEAGPVKQN